MWSTAGRLRRNFWTEPSTLRIAFAQPLTRGRESQANRTDVRVDSLEVGRQEAFVCCGRSQFHRKDALREAIALLNEDFQEMAALGSTNTIADEVPELST